MLGQIEFVGFFIVYISPDRRLSYKRFIYHDLNVYDFCYHLQSWEAVESSASTFTPDITPLTLAAHMNNYEILKILLDRGATLPMPHDVRFVFKTIIIYIAKVYILCVQVVII